MGVLLHEVLIMDERSTVLAVALAALLALSCGSGGGAGDFNLISIEEEWRLGQQLSHCQPMTMVRIDETKSGDVGGG